MTAVVLATLFGPDEEIDTIEKVVDALVAIRDAIAPDVVWDDPETNWPAVDGIATFSRLYAIITGNVLTTTIGEAEIRFADPDFLIELDLQFARRYLAAIRSWEDHRARPPACWALLFDARSLDRPPANYAAVGVNAHVNYDLAFALLETWRTYPPTRKRRGDYDLVNDIFQQEMDRLREIFPTVLAEIDDDGSWLDRLGNFLSSVLVRWTRSLAWDAAMEVWELYDRTEPDGGDAYRRAYERLERRLDAFAHATGAWLLDLDRVP